MSSWRRAMILSCLGLSAGVWGWSYLTLGALPEALLWPLWAWAGLALLSNLLSNEPDARRWHFTSAAVFAASLLTLQGCLNLDPPLPLSTYLQQQAQAFASLRWVPGVSTPSWSGLLPAAPFLAFTLFTQLDQPAIGSTGRFLAKAGLLTWCALLGLYVGVWLINLVPDAPTWFWGLLLLVLLLQITSGHVMLVLTLWMMSLAALFSKVLDRWIPMTLVRDGTLTAALALTIVSWLIWYARIEQIARFNTLIVGLRSIKPTPPAEPPAPGPFDFDLINHLDTPDAQEGADKYTRE